MKSFYYLIPCALMAALAPQAEATLIGNPLVPGTDASDNSNYVFNVCFSAPMPSDGTIDSLSIYQQTLDTLPDQYSFTVRLLHYTGTGDVYDQYYVSPVIITSGATGAVATYSLGGEVQVQAGDLFATYGQGIPFTASGATPDTTYYTGADFAPQGAGTIDLTRALYSYTANRVYSAAVDFTPASGSSPAPEPASLAVLGLGALGLWVRRKHPQALSQVGAVALPRA